jgi:hypothetical protein
MKLTAVGALFVSIGTVQENRGTSERYVLGV